MTSISTAIQTIDSNIAEQLLGNTPIDSTYIKHFEQYDNIFRIRHDLVHAAICDSLSVPFGEKTFEQVFSGYEFKSMRYYDDIKSQTPDSITVVGQNVKIFEVSMSVDLRSKSNKASKYALMIYFLRQNLFKVDYKIFVINPKSVYMNRDELLNLGLNDMILDIAKKVCDNCQELLLQIHKSELGQHFYRTRMEISESKLNFPFSKDDVIETMRENDNKCFHSESDIFDHLDSSTETITVEDDSFINHCVHRITDIESTLWKKEEFDEKSFIKDMVDKSRNKDLRSIFPLPYIKTRMTDSSIRSTENDWAVLSTLCGKMSQSQDSVMSTLAHFCLQNLNQIRKKEEVRNEDYLFVCKFTESEKDQNALEGPGRKSKLKHLERKENWKYYESSKEHAGYALDPTVDVHSLKILSFDFSSVALGPQSGYMEVDMSRILSSTGSGLDYVRICQSIFREININAMRGDRRRRFIIKPTGANGVFVCLYQGTKLRCGELVNNVWFKIIVDKDEIDENGRYYDHWAFKKIHKDNKIWYSGWLSCDVHRLDHYIRCFDKIMMSYCSLVSQRYRTTLDTSNKENLKDFLEKSNLDPSKYSLHNLIKTDLTNSLGMIILIYMEDRRSTSKMLQNVRYLIMTSISMFPRYTTVMEKFKEPIRSPLQLYCLLQCLDYIEQMKQWKIGVDAQFGNVKYDYKTHTFLDAHGGVSIKLPRPLLSSGAGRADFSEILCEMYFTMLFNKNQDDPTHASFQILDKIIEGEDNFKNVKKDNLHLGYCNGMTDTEFADRILQEKRVHMFSSKAIEVGAKLLRLDNGDPFGEQYFEASVRKNVNKTLDEYATYKSSSTHESSIFNPVKNRQNPRTRCIEQVLDLESKGFKDSFDVAKGYKKENTYYHVFKKNQIGGVREILILPITVRIRINILETISRNICKYDPREILTHGATKYDRVKSALYTSKKYDGNRAPIHLTFDKSKWGPGFVPIQFLYMFTPFYKKMGGLFYYVLDLLIKHQNKFCLLPDKLVQAWYKNTDKEHSFDGLQNVKKQFLKTKSLKMNNESNMGQGILHFTSSLLHLCMVSFRDELYKRSCVNLKWDHNDHQDLLSSDDSYTIFCPELIQGPGKALHILSKLKLFLKCQQISEYLFNCRTSIVKSSINPLIGEFNSLFIGNMTFIPTLMKFALSSVHPPNTDSFYRLVKESYGSSRQIVENGGSLELYYLSQLLNKDYAENIYHTYKGGANDLSKLGISKVPYHLGVYPTFNPALMVIFGPDYYNYRLFKLEWDHMNTKERNLFSSSHKMIKGGLIETMAEYEDGDTILGGLMRIEAAIGPIKQHQRIESQSLLSRDEISDSLVKNPLLMIKRPKTLEEIIFKTCQKIYTSGAKEAVKNIASSIYYGRVSATVSAKAFYIPNSKIVKDTYLNCLKQLIEVESPVLNLSDQIRFIYPKHQDYDLFVGKEDYVLDYFVRNPFEIQTIQSLVTHKIYTKLTQTVPDLLTYKWEDREIPEHLEGKVARDFDIMKLHYPMLKSTLQETKDQFDGDENQQTKALLLLILKLYSLRERTFKGVIFGYGSNDISRTYEMLMERNFSSGLGTKMTSDFVGRSKQYVDYDKIYFAVNHTVLKRFSQNESKYNPWINITESEINILLQDPSLNKTIKKRVFLSSISEGFIGDIENWSNKVGVILHTWLLKQKRDQSRYYGDFEICLFMGDKRLYCYYSEKYDTYYFKKYKLEDPELLYLFFSELGEIIEKTVEEMTSKAPTGNWVIINNKLLKALGGFEMKESIINPLIDFSGCQLLVDDKLTTLMDPSGRRVFNVETGLLTTDFIPPDNCDLRVFGLDLKKISSKGVFRYGFNVLYHDRNSLLDLLDDLVVTQPKISDVTKARLSLQDWETYDFESESTMSFIDDTSYFEDLISTDIDQLKEEILKEVSSNEVDINTADMVAFLMSTDSIKSMRTDTRVQHTRKIFTRLKNLKYDLIAMNFVSDMRLNKRIISILSGLIKNGNKKYILFSMISLYDRSYQVGGHLSPEDVTLNMNQSLIKKFSIRTKEEEELITFD
jgi:hypothetical protein